MKESKEVIMKLTSELLNEIKIAELAVKLNCSVAVLYNYKAGRSVPSTSVIKHMQHIRNEIIRNKEIL